jgi:hypothetical protein
MKKELKDYLHLYLGCECKTKYVDWENWSTETLTLKVLNKLNEDLSFEVKPILRSLDDITKSEATEGKVFKEKTEWHEPTFEQFKERLENNLELQRKTKFIIEFSPTEFIFLLSKYFDLFGLIDAGLAIDKTTLTPNP